MGQDILKMATDIVAAYVGNHDLRSDEIPGIIQSVHGALRAAEQGTGNSREIQKPAVTVKKSITPDYIICLEDGRKLKMLKRHLRTAFGMTPEEYRAKWGLPADYPMALKFRRPVTRYHRQLFCRDASGPEHNSICAPPNGSGRPALLSASRLPSLRHSSRCRWRIRERSHRLDGTPATLRQHGSAHASWIRPDLVNPHAPG